MSPARLARRARAALVLTAIALPALLATPAVTLADCMAPPEIDVALRTSSIVFVGTVTSTSNRDSWATVEVHEVWVGDNIPAEVVVKGGPGGNAATSVDRTFISGVNYLFFPYVGEDGGLADNSCTSTTEWMLEFNDLRPEGAKPPLAPAAVEVAGINLRELVVPVGAGLLAAVLLLGVGLLARGRQGD